MPWRFKAGDWCDLIYILKDHLTLTAVQRTECIFYRQPYWKELLFSYNSIDSTSFGKKKKNMLDKIFLNV